MRILALGDLHSGHVQGLTTPNYFLKTPKNTNTISRVRRRISALIERQVWKAYTEIIDGLGHIDVCFGNGDLIDGRGLRSGGSELITSDILQQCDIAIEALERVKADKYFLTYGTPYHCSDSIDYEETIASALNAEIDDYLNIKIKKVVFDVKHKMSSSVAYNSKGTGLLREINSALMWELSGVGNKIDVCIRSHVHYPFQLHDPIFNKYGFILPALEWSTKYGARQCLGVIAMGVLVIDISNKTGEISGWNYHIIKVSGQKIKLIKI